MQQLSDDGRRAVDEIAGRHGFSSDAVATMLFAVAAGHGNQAQFSHPEFGGMGQWSQGGMIMIGDMFNNMLAGRVASLCNELSGLVQQQSMFAQPAQSQTQSQSPGGYGGQSQMQGGGQQQQSGNFNSAGGGASLFVPGSGSNPWWPSDLGQPGSTGAQNNLRYAYFPDTRRIAIEIDGALTVYDSGPHQIGGVSQQQSGDQSLTFTSQLGVVWLSDLPVIAPSTEQEAAPATPKLEQLTPDYTAAPVTEPSSTESTSTSADASATPASDDTETSPQVSTDEIFPIIEKLADLRDKGILTDAEFATKKAELLARL